MYTLAKPLRILLLGAPGSGKGTQTSRLLKLLPSMHSVSSGDLLRKEINEKSEIGSVALDYISRGSLLPDTLISRLLTSYLSQNKWLSNDSSWLLDGFPRTANQANILDNQLKINDASLTLVVELKVPESVILDRIENRFLHLPSGRVYNLNYNPPKVPGLDDITKEPLSKRPDDNLEVFSKRLEEYNATLGPLKEHYLNAGVLHTVSGETSDIIFPQLSKLVTNMFNK